MHFIKIYFLHCFFKKRKHGSMKQGMETRVFPVTITSNNIPQNLLSKFPHIWITGPRHTLARRNARVLFIYICCLNSLGFLYPGKKQARKNVTVF